MSRSRQNGLKVSQAFHRLSSKYGRKLHLLRYFT
ncbi:unnamed protein product [Acanthoscelides obtectus]|uniref:Uncharacterized protein n=1 Tax=Acanthoscelides obtectus TaxID=200917 RepID=A0A9P0L1Z3_ACAOB|nr:unnamed protein product [Acanthoscelides obtectus]CAK1645808.1 hypothetical protein AOBTE_LOCUS14289 [Acanthoscelides obtectus]